MIRGGDKDEKENHEAQKFSPGMAKHVIQSFVKHLRVHLHRGCRQTQFSCFLSVHAFLIIFENSGEEFAQIAKEKEIINFLFSMMPYLFTEEAMSLAAKFDPSSAYRPLFNLNSLIIGQGFQGQQQNVVESQSHPLGNSQHFGGASNGKKGQPPLHSAGAARQSNAQVSPLNQYMIKQQNEERKVSRESQAKGFIHKLTFSRAISEPPSGNKNAVMPVTEDQNDEASSEGEDQLDRNYRVGILEEVQEEDHRLSRGHRQSIGGKDRQTQDKPVPPLQISQIHQINQQQNQPYNLNTAHAQPQTINSSSMVMTSYLNMPLGLFNNTINQMNSNPRGMPGPTGLSTGPSGFPSYKLNFIPHTTIAKSRLTRRQMSMTRKNTQKFSSISNFGQAIYGDDGGLSRDQGSRRQNPPETEIRGQDQSTSQSRRKGPPVPKLNINQIVYDNANQVQRIETSGHQLNTTSHGIAQMTNTNILKSSNRSNAYSNMNFENQLVAAQNRLSVNNINNPYHQVSATQNTRQIVIPSNLGGGDSDHNMSLYEDVNGSFIDDLGLDAAGQTVLGAGGFIFENAEEKLRVLAIQLGEACLTNDLAALISQKRDIELVKSARKTGNQNGRVSKTTKAAPSKLGQRSVSVSYNYEPFFGSSEIKSDAALRLDTKDSQTPAEEEKILQMRSLPHKSRLLVLNLIYQLLLLYDNSESRFLKHPISSLNAYIGSKLFKQLKQRQLYQGLETGKVAKKFKTECIVKTEFFVSGKICYHENPLAAERTALTDFESQQQQLMDNILSGKLDRSVLVDIEETIIFKIYQKFTFVNEEILRGQLENELANFAARERGLFGIALPYIMAGEQSQMTVPNLNLPLLGHPKNNSFIRQGSAKQLQQNAMLDELTGSGSILSSCSRDALSHLTNPNLIWSPNGIGFDFSISSGTSAKSTASTTFSKERIRKKLDVLLYQIDRRIKSLVSQQFQNYHQLERINAEFAKNLLSELGTLNTYLASQKSRIMLYQVIEVILESLLMIKKLLIDLALKTSIFVVDFSKNFLTSSITPESMLQGGSRSISGFTQMKSPHQNPRYAYQSKYTMIKTQQVYRSLFAEFLQLISNLLLMIPEGTSNNMTHRETMKLLNEIFISGDDQWQESVKTYVISLFLSDISSTFSLSKAFQQTSARPEGSAMPAGNITNQIIYHQQVGILIEELRGLNLANFDEQMFLQIVSSATTTLLQLDHTITMQKVKKSIYHMLLCAQNSIEYFQSVLIFYQRAISLYFTHRYGKQKTKNVNSGGGAQTGPSDDIKEKEVSGKVGIASGVDIRRGSASDQQNNMNLGQEENLHQMQKYWKQAVRKVLYQYMYLITPPNGLLSSYMLTNAINFINFGLGSGTNRFNATGRGGFSSVSPTRQVTNFFNQNTAGQEPDAQNVLRNGLCPLNFQLTVSTLNFLRLLFNLPDKFTKYAFLQDELILFYIRTHYISFVRLYNKNFSKKEQLTSSVKALESKERSMTLCKEHLNCLFAIARNRTEDTRRKLYQFKILQFLCQEIELEFECTTTANKQKRNRLLLEAKKSSTQVSVAQLQPVRELADLASLRGEGPPVALQLEMKIQTDRSKQEPPQVIARKPEGMPMGLKSLNLTGLAPPQLSGGQEQPVEEVKEMSVRPIPHVSVVKKLPFGIPKLNIVGLGLSEIVPDAGHGKTQIEIDQLRLLAEEQKKKAEQPPKSTSSSRRIPQASISRRKEQDADSDMTFIQKKESLDVNKGSKDSEESKIENSKPQPMKTPIAIPKLKVEGLGFTDIKPDLVQEPANKIQMDSSSSDEEFMKRPEEGCLPPPPKKPIAFAIPKLKVEGLGLSEIIPGTEGGNQFPSSCQHQAVQDLKEIKKPIGFIIPKLKVDGLGLSEIIPGTGDPVLQKPSEQEHAQPMKKNPLLSIPKLNVAGLGLSEIIPGTEGAPQNQLDESNFTKEPQSKPKGISIPKLNVEGLGFTDIKPDPVKESASKVLMDSSSSDEEFMHGTQAPPPPPPKKPMGFTIPKLQVEGLGLSEIIPGTEGANQNHPTIKSQPSQEQQQPPFKKPFGLSIPKLKVEGLGLSEIIPGTGDAEAIKNSAGEKIVIEKRQGGNSTHHLEEEEKQATSAPKSGKVKFSIPKLNVAGLGLSDLTPDEPVQKDLVTINPHDEAQSIDYGTTHHKQESDKDMLFQQRQSQRAQFENTAPVKMYQQPDKHAMSEIDQTKLTFQESSAPQDNRKVTKNLLPTRNEGNELSMKESLESAQFIHLAHRPQQKVGLSLNIPEDVLDVNLQHFLPKQDDPKININLLRESQQTQHLRLESVIDGQSAFSGSMTATPQPDLIQNNTIEGFNANSDAQSHFLTVNFSHGPAQMSKTPDPIATQARPSIIDQQEALSRDLDPKLPTPILKKPLIPSLKIPAKAEQPEGKEKIQQQIAYSQELNQAMEGGNLTMLQKELNKNNVKFQVLLQNQKSQKSLVSPKMAQELAENSLEDKAKSYEEEAFYMKERSMRPIYQDEDLHVMMLALIVCLLLTPERGTLDDLYCSQYPLDNGKQNVLFLLQHHINHPKNNQQALIQKVLEVVQKEVQPPLAGVRLLKLVSTSLFDISLYNQGKDWKKIAEGAYAKVYESKTNLVEPQVVAIKQLFLPKSIYDRCVLHDIFTEITCLEELRLEPCISDLYDYGVDGNSYYIVMKRYNCSLRQWRQNQSKSLNENLSLYLSIYKEFLKSLMTIHSHNVTHYDIKCDNVFLDFNSDAQSHSLSSQFFGADGDEERFRLTIGDFGECKVFSSEKDEFCTRNRGTDFCKSPEMLQLTINTRKDTDKYDRRKQVGTNRLSDVWSAGCLLYELLTGDFLFYTPDYLQFHFRVTRPSEALFTQDKLDRISNNVYLVDFMKYMLVRDPRLRPSIENVMKRFEHVHALLVSTTGMGSGLTNMKMTYDGFQASNTVARGGGNNIEAQLDQATQFMMIRPQSSRLSSQAETKPAQEPFLIKIMEDVALCNYSWISSHADPNLSSQQLLNLNITHIVLTQDVSKPLAFLKDSFTLLELKPTLSFGDGTTLKASSLLLMPTILDFLRAVSLTHGSALFIESSGILVRESILIALTHIYQTNAYETYTLIRSQNVVFRFEDEHAIIRLSQISQFTQLSAKVTGYLATYPRFQCKCGACTIILKRQYANYNNMETVSCNCCQYYRNVDSSQCPSPGCNEYIQFLKTYFKASQIENIQWGFIECNTTSEPAVTSADREPFLLGPKGQGNLHIKSKNPPNPKSTVSFVERMIASNMSQTIDMNSTLAAIVDKKTTQALAGGGGGRKGTIDSMFSSNPQGQGPTMMMTRWKLYKCKECHVWTHAETDNRVAILLNNRIKDNKNKNHFVNIRSLTAKKNQSAGSQVSVRVPILQKIKMNLPF